jgi:hypothetical protein
MDCVHRSRYACMSLSASFLLLQPVERLPCAWSHALGYDRPKLSGSRPRSAPYAAPTQTPWRSCSLQPPWLQGTTPGRSAACTMKCESFVRMYVVVVVMIVRCTVYARCSQHCRCLPPLRLECVFACRVVSCPPPPAP